MLSRFRSCAATTAPFSTRHALIHPPMAVHPPPRRQRAALVCRRWNGCVNSPELCSDVDLKIYLSVSGIDYWSKPLPEDLPSFAAWLERHGQHVRRLSLSAGSSNHDGAMMRQMAECWPAAVAAMPQLRQLHLEWMAGSLLEIGWLGQLAASLRELGLYASGYEQGLELASSLGGLTQLTKLMLAAGWVLVLNEGVQLPPSLRTLALNGRGEDQPVTGQASAAWRARLGQQLGGRGGALVLPAELRLLWCVFAAAPSSAGVQPTLAVPPCRCRSLRKAANTPLILAWLARSTHTCCLVSPPVPACGAAAHPDGPGHACPGLSVHNARGCVPEHSAGAAHLSGARAAGAARVDPRPAQAAAPGACNFLVRDF